MPDNLHAAALILVMSLTTILLRGLPFLLFSGKKPVPKVIAYLGEVLPSAVLGMLVIYCWRDISFAQAPFGARELLSSAVVALVQARKHNSILSILCGTACYMVLLHVL